MCQKPISDHEKERRPHETGKKVHADGYIYKKGNSQTTCKHFISCSISFPGPSTSKRTKIDGQERVAAAAREMT